MSEDTEKVNENATGSEIEKDKESASFEKSDVTGKGTATEGAVENLPDSVGESLEALVSVVLDSAEVANKSASVAASSSGALNSGIEKLNAAAKSNARNSIYILGACGLFLTIGAMLFVFMGTKLNSRVGQVDAMLLAVGKRVLEMDSGVDALGEMQSTLDQFNVEQLELQARVNTTQEELKNQIAGAIEASNSLATALPEKTADQVQKRTDVLLKQVDNLTKKVERQEVVIAGLKDELKGKMEQVTGNITSVEKTLNEIGSVKKDVEALVVIQKDRYIEKLEAGWEEVKKARLASEQEKMAALEKEEKSRELRYPREKEDLIDFEQKK